MKKSIGIVSILLLFLTLYGATYGQDDRWLGLALLLQAAQDELNDGELSRGQAYLTSATQLLTDDLSSDCENALGARALLENATTVAEASAALELLNGAMQLLARCDAIFSDEEVAPDPFQIAVLGVTRNADWEPYMQEFDGVQMVLVPAGCFMMGSENGEGDELPVHEQCFDAPFWIDKTEVTNEQFGGASSSSTCLLYSSETNEPRNCVSWFEARVYCEARGARLPTEREWEYAARGPDGLIYPWGNEFVAANIVHRDNSNTRTAIVGSRPAGASWVGALDMAGNVWEWTSTIYDTNPSSNAFPYPYNVSDGRENLDITDVRRTGRGGSFVDSMYALRGAVRFWDGPIGVSNNFGFRCARSY